MASQSSTLSNNIWRFLREVHQTRREKATSREEAQLRSALRQGFKEQERLLIKELDSIPSHFQEADPERPTPPVDLRPIWERITEETRFPMIVSADRTVAQAFLKGSRSLLADMAIDLAFDLEHPRATRFLEERGAQLIRGIDDTTRSEVQRILSNAVREGKSYGHVRTELRAKFRQFHTPQPQLHIRDRAELISVQEMGEAYEQGNLEAAEEIRDLGITLEKSSLTAEDTRVDELCTANERQGWIPLEQGYQSGAQRPPFHVACRCTQLVRRAA